MFLAALNFSDHPTLQQWCRILVRHMDPKKKTVAIHPQQASHPSPYQIDQNMPTNIGHGTPNRAKCTHWHATTPTDETCQKSPNWSIHWPLQTTNKTRYHTPEAWLIHQSLDSYVNSSKIYIVNDLRKPPIALLNPTPYQHSNESTTRTPTHQQQQRPPNQNAVTTTQTALFHFITNNENNRNF